MGVNGLDLSNSWIKTQTLPQSSHHRSLRLASASFLTLSTLYLAALPNGSHGGPSRRRTCTAVTRSYVEGLLLDALSLSIYISLSLSFSLYRIRWGGHVVRIQWGGHVCGADPVRRVCGGESTEEGARWWVRRRRDIAVADPSRSDSTPSRSDGSAVLSFSLCIVRWGGHVVTDPAWRACDSVDVGLHPCRGQTALRRCPMWQWRI
jgi:hypothetical protein